MPALRFVCNNAIPCGAGLGSSSAAIIAGVAAAFALMNKPLTGDADEALLQIASRLEGHVDNIAACLYGGIRLGVHTGSRWATFPVPTPAGLKVCVCKLLVPARYACFHVLL